MGSPSGTDVLIGYLALFVSCLSFGFSFVPLKRCDTKDGLFVQWVQCSVVFMAGLIINIARGLPPFNLVAAIGGFLYATGNIASVPIIAEMGIGIGMLTWGSVQIIVGWSVAKFGLFGTKAQHIQSPLINYLGVLITLISGAMFVFVYQQQQQTTAKDQSVEDAADGAEEAESANRKCRQNTTVPLRTANDGRAVSMGDAPSYGTVNARNDNYSPPVEASLNWGTIAAENGGTELTATGSGQPTEWKCPFGVKNRKLFFVSLAVCLGCLHGLMLTPIVYVQDNDQNASENVLDFVFSHFCAVFFFSTLYFVLYSLFRRGRPFVHPSLVLPSVAYGLLWSVGMTLFIVSNRVLSQPISFPVTVRLPAIIGALVDVFLFKDIRGRRRLAWLSAAIFVGSVGVILVGISLY